MGKTMNVSVYTTHEQTEQGKLIHHVTTLVVAGGLLTIECEEDVGEQTTHIAYYRFEPGQWTHFEVFA